VRSATERPNVVLIVADDLGYGDISGYGSTLNRTPAMDALAAQGVRLTDFYMSSPVCSPSRAALMTGCYPQRVGLGRGSIAEVLFPGDPIGLNPRVSTMPRLFLSAGYRTGMVGKWHLGDQPPFLPTRHGFERYFGLPYSNNMHPPERWHWEDGYRFPRLPLLADDDVIEQDPPQERLTDRYVDWALGFMQEHAQEAFFLYVAHMYVHEPILVPQEYLERSRNGVYGAAVEHLDATVGRLVAFLDDQGLRERTIVIVTSDNGSINTRGASNEPLRGAKFETFEGGVRVPCIVSWPGRTREPVLTDIITAMDLYPTLASACGLEPPGDPIDGIDLTGALFEGFDGTGRRETFLYYNADTLEAVRVGRWKYHIAGPLYDIVDDVAEAHDLSHRHPEHVQRLLAVANEAVARFGDRRRGIVGSESGEPGRVASPRPLTGYIDDAVVAAMYD